MDYLDGLKLRRAEVARRRRYLTDGPLADIHPSEAAWPYVLHLVDAMGDELKAIERQLAALREHSEPFRVLESA